MLTTLLFLSVKLFRQIIFSIVSRLLTYGAYLRLISAKSEVSGSPSSPSVVFARTDKRKFLIFSGCGSSSISCLILSDAAFSFSCEISESGSGVFSSMIPYVRLP